MRALEAVTREDLLVVDDDPVVDPDDAAVPDRVVVREDRRVALREVPDVDEHLAGRVGDGHAVEEAARSRPLLVHRNPVARAERVAGGVGAALGDPREEGLRGQRPAHPRTGAEAVASDAAHVDLPPPNEPRCPSRSGYSAAGEHSVRNRP